MSLEFGPPVAMMMQTVDNCFQGKPAHRILASIRSCSPKLDLVIVVFTLLLLRETNKA